MGLFLCLVFQYLITIIWDYFYSLFYRPGLINLGLFKLHELPHCVRYYSTAPTIRCFNLMLNRSCELTVQVSNVSWTMCEVKEDAYDVSEKHSFKVTKQFPPGSETFSDSDSMYRLQFMGEEDLVVLLPGCVCFPPPLLDCWPSDDDRAGQNSPDQLRTDALNTQRWCVWSLDDKDLLQSHQNPLRGLFTPRPFNCPKLPKLPLLHSVPPLRLAVPSSHW